MEVLSPKFRRALIRAILRDPAFLIDRRKCLSPDLFPEDGERTVVAIVLEHFDNHGAPPDDMVLEIALEEVGWEEEEIAEAVDLFYHQGATQVGFVRERVLEFAQKRHLETTIERIAETLDEADFDEIRRQLLDAAFFGDEEHAPGQFWSDGMAERLKKYKTDRAAAGVISTGIASVDMHMDGGLAPTEMGVILAPPNTGKTTALTSIGCGALSAGKRVVHYTLEMSADTVARRYDMALLGMTKGQLRKKQGTAWKKMLAVSKQMTDQALLIKEWPMHSATPSSVVAHLDLIAERDGFLPDVVILDYASIMRSNRKYDALRHEIASIFRELHALSHEKRVPLWTAHQTNRGGMQSKVIGMEDLGECFEVGAIADVIISLNQTLDERRRGIMRMHFAKNRENEAGATEAVAVDFTLSRIRDYDD